jgi:hypothetical protein
MSIASLDIIIDRIKSAHVASQISVFKVMKDDLSGFSKQQLNAVFDDTAMTKNWKTWYSSHYVGTYNRKMDMEEVNRQLKRALK